MAAAVDGTRWCSKCERALEVGCFSRRTASKDGLCYRCKKCASTINAQWRADNPDKVKEHNRNLWADNIVERTAYNKTYYELNRDKLVADERRRREENIEDRRSYDRIRWHDPDSGRQERHKEWRKDNPDIVANGKREYRARKHAAPGECTKEDVACILHLQRGLCAYCRRDISNSYTADHIIPLSGGGSNDRRNIQLTCQSCNSRKKDKHPIIFAQQLGLLL